VLVGREQEVSRLVRLLEERSPAVVIGEAGVGKTSVVRAAVAKTGLPTFEGGGLATLSWLPLLPLQRALGELPNGDPEYVAREIERAVGDGILFVDDLQWADGLTRSALSTLAGRIRLLTAVRKGDPGAQATLEALSTFERLELEPLDRIQADALALHLRPDIPEAELRSLVDRSGGNPFLLEQLAAGDEPSLRQAVSARLRQLSEPAQEVFQLLALLGRPAARELLSESVDELEASGLVVANGSVAPRHALLAETAVAELDDEVRKSLHRRLAGALDDRGEVARHLAGAGDLEEAFAAAIEAAESSLLPSERAAHLMLASECAPRGNSTELRIEAATALVSINLYVDADRVLASIDTAAAPESAARVHALSSRARWTLGDPEGALAEVAKGLVATKNAPLAEQIPLLIEDARLTFLVTGDVQNGLEKAEHAAQLAEEHGLSEPRARYILGTAHYLAETNEWDDHFRAAIDAARRRGDRDTEMNAAINLVIAHESSGSPAEGRKLTEQMIKRAVEFRLAEWERAFLALQVNLDFHAGEYTRVLSVGRPLLGDLRDPRFQDRVGTAIALALVDLGQLDEARQLVDRLFADAADDSYGRGNVLLVAAELEQWAGRPRQARVRAEEAIEKLRFEMGIFPAVIRAWACFDLGVTPPEYLTTGPLAPAMEGARTELLAVGHLAVGEAASAIAGFDEAAEQHAPWIRRAELRCRWAAGEACRQAGQLPEARQRLEAVEQSAFQYGMEPLLHRVRRSLRLAGVRRSAARETDDRGLTAREREILALARKGLSNPEIGRQLGISSKAVEHAISSAARKLGVRGRVRAAAAAAGDA